MEMTGSLQQILAQYPLDGSAVSCERYGAGHINETYLAVTSHGRRYILQKINHHIFRDVPALMANIGAVTAWLRRQSSDPRTVLHLVETSDGRSYLSRDDGTFWRVYDFVEDSLCLQQPETPEDFYESAVAFGTFQQLLRDFPAGTLTETIPHFHDTPDRYRLFRRALEADALGRAKEVQPEIAFVLEREGEAPALVDGLRRGDLPLRVTHNDTKLNNVMLDAQTRKALCVIDLDTVMPGLSLYDFGDSIRFGAASAAEDERDLSRMEMRLDLFETYTRGFLSACPSLTAAEVALLPMGAKLMTLECGVRFLTDYLEGDHYFATHRPGHNLDRCRTQFKLVADMEAKWGQMRGIVDKLAR